MAGTELVATKYAACAEFDPSSGQCTTVVWVDAPSPIPPLTAEQGAVLGGATLVVWAGVIAMVLIRKGARLDR